MGEMEGTRRRRFALAAGGLALAGGSLAGVLVATGAAGAARTSVAARASRPKASDTPPMAGATVTVTGDGSVMVAPDTLTLQIGATTNASTATAALERNNADIARLEAALRAAGIGSAEMQTSNLQLSTNTNDKGIVTGYQASDDLTVTSHQLAGAGAVIDAAAHAVGNDVQIQGISFSRSDLAPSERAARVAAVRQAAAAAATLAAAAGARLGGIVKIDDEAPAISPVTMPLRAAAAASAAVPIQPGKTSVSAQVQVVYALVG